MPTRSARKTRQCWRSRGLDPDYRRTGFPVCVEKQCQFNFVPGANGRSMSAVRASGTACGSDRERYYCGSSAAGHPVARQLCFRPARQDLLSRRVHRRCVRRSRLTRVMDGDGRVSPSRHTRTAGAWPPIHGPSSRREDLQRAGTQYDWWLPAASYDSSSRITPDSGGSVLALS